MPESSRWASCSLPVLPVPLPVLLGAAPALPSLALPEAAASPALASSDPANMRRITADLGCWVRYANQRTEMCSPSWGTCSPAEVELLLLAAAALTCSCATRAYDFIRSPENTFS